MKTKNDEWALPLYKIYTDEEDVELITKIIKRGTQWAIGPEIEEFENGIKEYVGCDYCVSLNSGTSALHATFLAYGLGSGDEIIVPSFSFIATANSTLFVNSTPRFADIEEKTHGLDSESIKIKINSSTKAIVPMDYGGVSCDILKIKEVAAKNNLILIEDAAEGLGASVHGKKVGSLSDCAIFSFCGNKVLTTGEGGAVVTNSKEIYDKLKLIRSHGRIDGINYFDNPESSEYRGVGYNWRMSTMVASLGISQLSKLDKLVSMRQNNAEYITERISKHKEIEPPYIPNGFTHIYQMYSIKLPDKETRDSLHEYLLKNKIFCKIYFDPIHLTSYYKKNFSIMEGSLPVTENVSSRILTLPMYPNMTNEEKKYLTDSIDSFFETN